VNLDEVVREVIDGHGRHVVFNLPAETIRQPRVAAHRRANRPILALYIRRAHVRRIGAAGDHRWHRADALRRAVAALVLLIVSV